MIFTEAEQRWMDGWSEVQIQADSCLIKSVERPSPLTTLYSNNIDSAQSLQSQPTLSPPLFLCLFVILFLEPKKGKLKQKDSANVMALRKRRERESKKTRDRVDRNERKAQIEAPPGSSSVWGCVFDKKKKKTLPLYTSEETQMDRCFWNSIEWQSNRGENVPMSKHMGERSKAYLPGCQRD